MLTQQLTQLINQHQLDKEQAYQLVEDMLKEETPSEQIAACMALLNQQHDNIELLAGIALCMREHMLSVNTEQTVLDIVGTGGDGANTINVSTGSALLMAACGVPVAKHGNRAVSSQCGSADVLESLGLNLEQTAEQVSQSIHQYQFGFCFAPNFHPALLKLRTVRKKLGIPTVFNLMGPLLNPAQAKHLMIGVYQAELVPTFAKVLAQLPIKNALVFHSAGLDELSCAAPAHALLIKESVISELTIDCEDYDLPRCQLDELAGGDAAHNASLLLDVFAGADNAIANTLLLNAGVGLMLYGKANSIQAGIDLAKAVLKAGKVMELVERLKNPGETA